LFFGLSLLAVVYNLSRSSYRTPSSFPCTASTCYPWSTRNSFSTVKSIPGKADACPPFFILQTDKGIKGEFPPGSEIWRRIPFFAQSSTTSIPELVRMDTMPASTFLTSHYGEKVRFYSCRSFKLAHTNSRSLEEDQNTPVPLLEYLKQLHLIEWERTRRSSLQNR
jgi:hypothetical protein